MTTLNIPNELRGPWEHALFLTYGADLVFFERLIARELPERCRNRIILADARQFAEACEVYAESGGVRHLNRRYVVQGVAGAYAAHAKLILLIGKDRGRLLVGSGNLSLPGYAGGGEIFTKYEYAEEDRAHLSTFARARDLLRGFIEREFVAGPVVRQIEVLLDAAPWMLWAPRSDRFELVHNLDTSMLEHLRRHIADRDVEELWIHAPFHDDHAAALRELLNAVRPAKVVILVQPDQTHANPVAIQRVLEETSNVEILMRPFTKRASGETRERDIYVHAKFYLAKQGNAAICMQGSPNISTVALVLTAGHGNLETAVIHHGQRDAFDGLLDDLELQPPVQALDEISFASADEQGEVVRDRAALVITFVELDGRSLTVGDASDLLQLGATTIEIDGQRFDVTFAPIGGRAYRAQLPDEPLTMLASRAIPLRISLADGSLSPPVFPLHRAELHALLDVTDDSDLLHAVADLELDSDDEFARLLDQLQDALVIDRRSLWRVAGRDVRRADEIEEDAPPLRYEDIDYDALRRHPKLAQYRHDYAGGSTVSKTRLQIILSAITDKFHGLVDTVPGTAPRAGIDDVPDETDLASEEEREELARDEQRRRQSSVARRRRLLDGFLKRYLRGLQSRDFLEIAGYEVVVTNYAIFSHLLLELLKRDEWLPQERTTSALVETWEFMWGSGESGGYFTHQMSDEERELALRILAQHQATGQMLASLHTAAVVTRADRRRETRDLRSRLRSYWRHFVVQPPIAITNQVLAEALIFSPALAPSLRTRAQTLVADLAALAELDDRTDFLRDLERRFELPYHACQMMHESVKRPGVSGEARVECLTINTAGALSDPTTAQALLSEWARFEHRDYYRISYPSTNSPNRQQTMFYDRDAMDGEYSNPDDRSTRTDLTTIQPAGRNWDLALARLRQMAIEIDEQRLVVEAASVSAEASAI